jgi:hypothetical protein
MIQFKLKTADIGETVSDDYTVMPEMLRISKHTWLVFHLLLNLIM